MGEPRRSRSKHIGFKPKGVDPGHDLVYSVLDALPRGGASDFIVLAVMDFLQNHAGETVTGSGKRKYIILGDYSNLPFYKTDDPDAGTSEIPLSAAASDRGVTDRTLADQETFQEIPPPDVLPSVQDDTPLLDEDTLESLVLGFPSDY